MQFIQTYIQCPALVYTGILFVYVLYGLVRWVLFLILLSSELYMYTCALCNPLILSHLLVASKSYSHNSSEGSLLVGEVAVFIVLPLGT